VPDNPDAALLEGRRRLAVDYLFADEMEVESIEQVAEERPVFLILAEPQSLLGRRFVLQPVEILIAFPLFPCRWKLPFQNQNP
jgi:hypothetical protein